MRDMNDNLIARIVSRWAIFISIWFQTMALYNVNVYVDGRIEQALCTGTFNDHDQMMSLQISPDKLKLMDDSIASLYFCTTLLYSISMIFLMVAIQIKRYKTPAPIHTPKLERPKDMESMVLNFSLLILIVINEGGMDLWRR